MFARLDVFQGGSIIKSSSTRKKKVTTRFNQEEWDLLEIAEKILGTDQIMGEKSETIRRCIEFTVSNHEKPVRDFNNRYGTEEKRRIYQAFKRGDIVI